MTDHDLEQRLRAWYRAEIPADVTAPADLRSRVVLIPQAQARSRRSDGGRGGSRRGVTLLAAAALLATALVGGALVAGSRTRPPPSDMPAAIASPTSVRPAAALIRIAGHDVSVVLPDGLEGRLPAHGDVGNGITWGNNDDEVGRTGSRWRQWSLFAPSDIDDPRSSGDHYLPLPSDPVAWLHGLSGLTVLAERDVTVGGRPARLMDVVTAEGGPFMYEVPVGDSGATRSFVIAGGTHSRLVIWRLDQTWMVAQATANRRIIDLERPDAPDDAFMRFVADLRFP
jgi:hypothetical protein